MKKKIRKVSRLVNRFFYIQGKIDKLSIFIDSMEDFFFLLTEEDYSDFREHVDVIEVYNFFRKLQHRIGNILERIEELEEKTRAKERIVESDIEIVEE